jgi:hypothetical protein
MNGMQPCTLRSHMALTSGEILFEQYLSDRGIAFEYESASESGGRRPDYLLKTEPRTHCEVKDLELGPQDRAEMESFKKGNRVGSKGPDQLFGRIRDTIAKAAKQLRSHKGEPCAVILYNANSFVNLASFLVGGAMFGDPVIAVPLDGGEPSTAFTGGRTLGDTKNTTIGAVAVVSRTNANQHLIDQTMAKLGPWKGPGLPSVERVTEVVEALDRLYEERPEAALQVPFLTVHYNPYAVAPLPEQVFSGPHDRHIKYLT